MSLSYITCVQRYMGHRPKFALIATDRKFSFQLRSVWIYLRKFTPTFRANLQCKTDSSLFMIMTSLWKIYFGHLGLARLGQPATVSLLRLGFGYKTYMDLIWHIFFLNGPPGTVMVFQNGQNQVGLPYKRERTLCMIMTSLDEISICGLRLGLGFGFGLGFGLGLGVSLWRH